MNTNQAKLTIAAFDIHPERLEAAVKRCHVRANRRTLHTTELLRAIQNNPVLAEQHIGPFMDKIYQNVLEKGA